ncbi:MAG: DUF2508 family protein [Clostridiales bacterium]|nr:DUF2508 family protein [Clostridiales bacterium]
MLDEKRERIRRKQGRQEELRTLQEELSAIRLALRQAEGKFNTTSDPQLVEAAVFEIKALQARHAYLLRSIKEEMAVANAASCPQDGTNPAGSL